MDRRHFMTQGAGAVVATSLAKKLELFPKGAFPAESKSAAPRQEGSERMGLGRYRFGVNYTPSNNWWFCWNDWNVSPVKRDLDAIAALGADHLRIMLIWPYFQPNLTWVSGAHLERLSELLALMGERGLDAVVTVFTGQLSGWFFLPPFNKLDAALYTDPEIWAAQELLIKELARTMKAHDNILGFDFGNEVNTCWSAEPAVGDAWMVKMFALMNSACPRCVHVNGTDHKPWFQPTTFSPRALAANPFPVVHAYPYWTNALKYGGPLRPAKHPVAGRLCSAGPLLCRSSAEADLGWRIQHLYRVPH